MRSPFRSLVQPAPREAELAPRRGDLATTGAGCVHVVDGHEEFRRAVAGSLSGGGVEVVSYASADEFGSSYAPRDVECVIVDWALPDCSGGELVAALRSRYILSPVIVVSDRASTADIVQAIQRGALDFLEKPIPDHILQEKIGAALTRDRGAKERRGNIERRLSRLTDREREVMDLLIAAKTTIQTAHVLGISPKTVEKHRIRVFDKLDVDSVPALIRLMIDAERGEE
jgi:two-component system response regulator FixJ